MSGVLQVSLRVGLDHFRAHTPSALRRQSWRVWDITLCVYRQWGSACMAVFFSQPGPRSMLKVDKSRTKCHNGFPRASDRPRMCPMSFGLLLFLWCFVADGQATSSPSPCPSMCNCYTLSPTSTDSVVDCSNAGLTTLSSIPYLFLPNSKWKVVQL